MKILVTGAGALLGQGVIRALQASTLKPRTVAVDPSPLAAGLYWADSAHLVPMAGAPDYLDRLGDVLRRERVDAVLVGTDVELTVLAAHRQEIADVFGARVVVSSPEVV